jgi:3-methyl-2-oxobutanoate hydroxymethyltransferase
MVHRNTRPTVADIRAMKARGEKISMLYVTTPEEAAAADAAGIHMLSIEGRFFSPEMRAAAGRCFVQVGLPYGGWGMKTYSAKPTGTGHAMPRHIATSLPSSKGCRRSALARSVSSWRT